MVVCAFDIGGTSIKYGVLDEQGAILFKAKTPTKSWEGGPAVLNRVKEIARQLQEHDDFTGIAVSTAGQIDKQNGTVIHATESLPNYTGLAIKQELEQTFHLPTVVDNDVNCAALGEYWKGAAAGLDHFLCMTLGTGIGGAVVIHGKVYSGAGYSAGEFGHMTLYPGGRACQCGDRGCYEQYASSSALEQSASRYLERNISLPSLFHQAKQGDSAADAVIDRWSEDVALGMKTLVHLFNPSAIVIGGGVSEQGEYLLQKLQEKVNAKIMASFQRPLQLKMAQNGNDANLQGAVYLLKKAQGK